MVKKGVYLLSLSEFEGPYPKDMGYKENDLDYTKPAITDKKLQF
jgi:hypothetical protein